MLKKSIKQLLAYYSYYLIMAIIVCILQFQIQQMFWKNTEKLHTSTLNLPTFKTIDPYWSKKNDQGLTLAIGFAVQLSSLQGSPINVMAKMLWNKPTLIITITTTEQGYAIQQ